MKLLGRTTLHSSMAQLLIDGGRLVRHQLPGFGTGGSGCRCCGYSGLKTRRSINCGCLPLLFVSLLSPPCVPSVGYFNAAYDRFEQ